MTKNELIRLKKKIETKVHIVDAYSGSGPISLLEIEKQINTVGAVENIEKYFENIIMYFSSKGVKYDKISIGILFSIIVKEKDLDEKTVIKTNSKPLPSTVDIFINGFRCMDGKEIFGENPEAFYSNCFNNYIVIFDDFIKLLEEKGFEFKGASTTEELKEKIIAGKPTFGEVTLNFDKRKIRTKV